MQPLYFYSFVLLFLTVTELCVGTVLTAAGAGALSRTLILNCLDYYRRKYNAYNQSHNNRSEISCYKIHHNCSFLLLLQELISW